MAKLAVVVSKARALTVGERSIMALALQEKVGNDKAHADLMRAQGMPGMASVFESQSRTCELLAPLVRDADGVDLWL